MRKPKIAALIDEFQLEVVVRRPQRGQQKEIDYHQQERKREDPLVEEQQRDPSLGSEDGGLC